MATRRLEIPGEFGRAANKFVRETDKFMKLTEKMQKANRRNIQQRMRQQEPSVVGNMFRRMDQSLTRLEVMHSRTIGKLEREFGFARFFGSSSAVEGILTRINTNMIEAIPIGAGARAYAGVFLGPVGMVVGTAIYAVVKLIGKMAALSTNVTADYFGALGLGTDVAGLRSFGITFGQFGITLGPTARGLSDITSQQFLGLHALRIQRKMNMADSADVLTSAIVEAARYLKGLPEGAVLSTARYMGLSGLFTDEQIITLRTMPEAEIERLARLYARRRKEFRLPPDTIMKFVNFNMTLRNASIRISTGLLKLLTQGHPSIVEGITKITDAFTKIIVKWFGILRKLNMKLIRTLRDNLQALYDTIDRILRILGLPGLPDRRPAPLYRPGIGPRARAREAALKPSGPMFRPGVGPRARRAAVEGPLFRGVRKGGPQERGRPAIGPRARRESETRQRELGAPPELPPSLRAPKAPAEAPETIPEAQKGGFIRGGGTIDRSQFVKELQEKPWLRQKAAEIAAAEEGTDPQGTQMILESAMNRAKNRHTSLEKELRWTDEGGYYAAGGRGRGQAMARNPKAAATLDNSLNNALGGSDAAAGATDNSSGSLAERDMHKPIFRFIKRSRQGDSFFAPGPADAKRAREWNDWRNSLKPGTGTPQWTIQDIKEMDGAPKTVAPPAQTPGAATPGAKLAPSGTDPTAIIIHHTGDRHSAQRNVEIWRGEGRGIGAQYIVDRDGTIHDVEAEFGYKGTGHIHPTYTPQELKDKGVVNKNVIGFEVTGTSDKDITPAQIKAVKDFVGKNYPNTPVYGHGEVNPGHREADEGKTIVDSIRADRAQNTARTGQDPPAPAQPVSGQRGSVQMGPEPNQSDRPDRIAGKVRIGDETFDYASGGMKRGSMPYGTYPVNIGEGDIGPIGQRIGSVATVGALGGEIPDPKYPGHPRAGIQIHPWDAASLDKLYSEGCFTIPRQEWPAFKAALLKEAQKGKLALTVNRDGRAVIQTRDQLEASQKKPEKPPPMQPNNKYDKPPIWPEDHANKKSILYTGKHDDDEPKNKVKVEHNDSESDVHVQESPATDLYNAPM